jgi:exosortase J
MPRLKEMTLAGSPAAGTAATSFAAVQPLIAAALLGIGGLALFWRQFSDLWAVWTGDSLQSVGVLVLPASALLMMRTLDRRDFSGGGSWWGLVPVTLALALSNFQLYGPATLGWGGGFVLSLMPTGLILCLYATGVMLLLGGAKVWHKTAFALLLILCVKPVPGFFISLVDLPLQHLGAEVARGFGRLLHVPVTGAALNLMFFHDELGMFVAPACNGLQGATAMGLAALVIGHLRNMKLLPHVLFVAGAVLLAYVFNLIRLCALVLYYCVAHLFPLLGTWAVGADYAIGGVLFLSAALLLFKAPLPVSSSAQNLGESEFAPIPPMRGRLAALAALLAAFAVLECYAQPASALTMDPGSLRALLLPARIGEFNRTRQWSSGSRTHTEIGATYQGADGIEVGLSIWLDGGIAHNAIACWFVRDDIKMLQQEVRAVRTETSEATFDTGLFVTGAGPVLLASTECYRSGCRERPLREGFGLRLPSVSRPGPVPISVMVRETGRASSETDSTQIASLAAAFDHFAAALNLDPLLGSGQGKLAAQPATEEAR